MKNNNNYDRKLGTEGKNCVVAQVTFYANKNNVFLSIEGNGVLYIKSLVHSNPYFRFFQGPKCMLAL